MLILGDSHSVALQRGCDKLEIPADGLSYSGSAWHEGKFAFGSKGFEPRAAKQAQANMARLRERVGTENVFQSGPPVIASFGFHLGRMTPPLSWHGHHACSDGRPMDFEKNSISSSFLREYVAHHRRKHIRVAKMLSRSTKLILVAPPPAFERPNFAAVHDMVVEQLTAAGLTVYDPKVDFTEPGGTLGQEWLLEDGIHGTPDYGAKIVSHLIDRGLLDRAVSA